MAIAVRDRPATSTLWWLALSVVGFAVLVLTTVLLDRALASVWHGPPVILCHGQPLTWGDACDVVGASDRYHAAIRRHTNDVALASACAVATVVATGGWAAYGWRLRSR